MKDYNKNLRPRGKEGDDNAPTIVSTSLMIKSISTVKEQNMVRCEEAGFHSKGFLLKTFLQIDCTACLYKFFTVK